MNTAACRRDRGNRRGPRGWRSYALGAAAATALLATTACESGSDDAKISDRPSGTATASTATPAATTATATATTGGSGAASATTSPTPSATGAKDTIAACTDADLATSAVKEPADSKEARHLLITVQNAGDKKCDVYGYPRVRLGADARTTVPVIKDSDPDPGKPVTLAPGDEASAALLVSGGQRDEYEAKSITVTLQGSKPGSTTGKPLDVPLPVSRLYADDGQLVTYWTTASGSALDFIMSK